MLHLVRNHSPFTVLILFIYCLLLHLPVLSHPLAPEAGGVVYRAILALPDALFHGNAFCYTLLGVVLIFAQGHYLNGIAERHRLFLNNTYVPLFAYISLASLLPEAGLFSPVLIALWPVLAAVEIVLSFPQPQSPRANIFNAGFLLGLAALIYFPATCFVLFLILALMMFRPLNAGEWIVGLLGYFTPFYFMVGILFLADGLPLLRAWPAFGISLPRQMKAPLYLSGGIGGVIVLLWSGLYALQGALSRFAISVRRGWGAVVIALVISTIVAIISPAGAHASWLMPLPMLALIASGPVANEKRGAYSTFIFLFIVALAVFGLITKPH